MSEADRNGDRTDEHIGRRATDDVSDVVGLLGHFYRGQMDRVLEWRSRLDQTTYWAVTILAAILTYSFSNTENPHYLLLIGMLVVVLFLVIDARRYRIYDVWRSRIRTLETHLFVEVFDPEAEVEHRDWRQALSRDLKDPSFEMTYLEAFARRLGRVYLPLLMVLLVAWAVRLVAFSPDQSGFASAGIESIPGVAVVGTVAVTYLGLLAVAIWGHWRVSGERNRDDWVNS